MNYSANRSTNDQVESELTTRARIRHAALTEFAEHGFKGASIRGIARAAGVSPGLVQHHFGTKDGLRQACDAYVMEFLHETQQRLLQRGTPPSPGADAESFDQLQPVTDYLIMSLASGSDTAATWFRNITEYTHEALVGGRIGPPLDSSTDRWAIAATQAAMALGVAAFYRNIQDVLGVEDESEAIVRVGRARLFLASDRILSQELRERLAESLDNYERIKGSVKPPPSSGNRSTGD